MIYFATNKRMNILNINIPEACRTSFDQKDDLISLYSVDNITGMLITL